MSHELQLLQEIKNQVSALQDTILKQAVELLSDKEVAAKLKVSKSWVWSAARAGTIPRPIKVGEKITRWRSTDIANYINKANNE
jgi:predicted DNA-binding transcriptional regulator AlpA